MSADGSVLTAHRTTLADLTELTKPRITTLVVFTALVGFAVGSPGPIGLGALGSMLLGTALVAAGASAFNMLLERDTDALMHRTRDRPLPAGRVRPDTALMLGGALTAVGLLALYTLSGPLPALVAFVTWFSYVFVYTPLKTRTSLSTLVGAVPGALPPVIGWSAARGEVDAGAYLLFAILFLWQIPHFLAIAWIYREDYARGGLPMLPVIDQTGHLTGRQVLINTVALFVVSLAPYFVELAGIVYLVGACIVNWAMLLAAFRFATARSLAAARHLFYVSIVYLSVLCALLLIDRA
jgi:protoheme IX farnesyltransferase